MKNMKTPKKPTAKKPTSKEDAAPSSAEEFQRQRIEGILTPWLEQYRKISAFYDAVQALTRCAPESQFGTLLFGTFEMYEKCVAAQVRDTFDFLSWFRLDNKCGENGMAAKASGWRIGRKIATVKDLAALLAADYEINKPL
jgi:hypothetical protein